MPFLLIAKSIFYMWVPQSNVILLEKAPKAPTDKSPPTLNVFA